MHKHTSVCRTVSSEVGPPPTLMVTYIFYFYIDVTGVTITEVSPLIRKVSTAPNIKDVEEGRVPQTDTFVEIVETMLDTK